MCVEVLPHVSADKVGSHGGICFVTEIQNAVKMAGEKTCDLLNQQQLDSATAELEVRVHPYSTQS